MLPKGFEQTHAHIFYLRNLWSAHRVSGCHISCWTKQNVKILLECLPDVSQLLMGELLVDLAVMGISSVLRIRWDLPLFYGLRNAEVDRLNIKKIAVKGTCPSLRVNSSGNP